MKIPKIIPVGWSVDVLECPPGHFMCNEQLCFKTEYGSDEIYNSAGERFVTRDIQVTPCECIWEEE